jgi:hypothetical protein
MARRIKGAFCEREMLPKSAFDRRSFRWKKSGGSWVMTGCRRGKFKRGRCTNGLRAHVVLVPARGGSCLTGGRLIHKR